MKIYFIINSPYPYYAGGIENWLYNVSERLSEKYEIIIISLNQKDYPNFYSDISDRIKFYQIDTLRTIKFLKPILRSYLVLFDFILGAYLMGRKLKAIIDKNEHCCIVALDSMFCVKAAIIGKDRNNRARLISSVRGPHAEILGKAYPLFSKSLLKFEKRMLGHSDQIWANGYDTIDLLKEKNISSSLMRNGVDFEFLSHLTLDDPAFKTKIANKTSIVSVGTLLPIKGIYELIDALKILKAKGKSDIILVFIGKGNTERYINYAKKNNVHNYISFLGHKKDPIKYVKECSVVACLSGGSGMSMAAIEAMTSGKPILAWDSPVYKQFNKDKQTMLLVEEKNSNSLADGISEICNNYEYYIDIGKNALNESKKYDWSYICNDIVEKIEYDF